MAGYDPPRGAFEHGYPYWHRKERMKIQPHGFTVLVEPDTPPGRSDSGLIVMPDDSEYLATSGTVVAVGKGSKRLWEARQKALRKALDAVYDSYYEKRIRALLDVVEPTPSVCVGDRVVFAAEAGLNVTDEGKSYILLEEDRIAIIVDEESEVA